MPTVLTPDGVRLHATAYGPADADLTVLLAHCWTADEELWHYQVRDLLSRPEDGLRLRVVTWDARAHGRSEVTDEETCTIDHLARDLGAVADALAPTGPLVLAGHSIGGMTLMALPEHRPDLVARTTGLLLVATSAGGLDAGIQRLAARLPRGASLTDRVPGLLALRARRLGARRPEARARRRTPAVERLLTDRMLLGTPVRPRDAALVADQLAAAAPATMAGFVRDLRRHDRAHLLGAWDGVPTVVVAGTADRLTPLSHARRLAAGIRGARLLVLPDAGHYLPLERDAVVSEHLLALVAAGAPTRA
ncbi:alpha/beta fold hydrolase [Nocardioides sp. GY 10127]|uniref:alpha/beta fold hydrolase n=1 Tax=Nocardioides sp. GY 10127 TaxID=2569762 RepID=UPI0010A94517|nr:alpha/beta fold hydrolase [Nocardioides sp. GY 10127]TIC78897.1 alpha/beta fold hydrolase [Nocardioides sp. GY 10127]